jgi:hypothetical protein
MKANTALFTGRFQPPSLAHVATVKTILSDWPSLVIGVSSPDNSTDYDPRWQPFLDASRGKFTDKSAMFTPHEVKEMWDAWISAAGLENRVRCELIPRPHLRAFTRKYPSCNFDMVYPAAHKDDSEGDKQRHLLFPVLLEREIFLVEPSFRQHNSETRLLIREGKTTWKQNMPDGAYDVFIRLNGPQRMT